MRCKSLHKEHIYVLSYLYPSKTIPYLSAHSPSKQPLHLLQKKHFSFQGWANGAENWAKASDVWVFC